jgi:hypothetical protein
MTAFTCNSGGVENWDSKSGGSVNATLDSYTISNGTTLLIDTDTYQCANHSTAFGSVDTVTFSGTGGKLKVDGTNVRVIPYNTGTGNVPAIGTTISQGGVSATLLGVWSGWQAEPTAAAAAMPASGYIKVKNKTGGDFAAGALTGIGASATGADVVGWIEVRGADTAAVTVPRLGAFEVTGDWFELGTTNGTRGQVIPCPTTASVAGVFPGVWIETASGSGVYERFSGAGSIVALSTIPTDERGKIVWQTTSGIRIGSDGTNNVGFLPPTGCKVRIPNVIFTCCTRTASGSGPRVLPNATLATRQEFVTTAAGDIAIDKAVLQWYGNFLQAYRADVTNSAVSDALILQEIAGPVNVDNVIVSPTQAQLNFALYMLSCFAGGTVQNARAGAAGRARATCEDHVRDAHLAAGGRQEPHVVRAVRANADAARGLPHDLAALVGRNGGKRNDGARAREALIDAGAGGRLDPHAGENTRHRRGRRARNHLPPRAVGRAQLEPVASDFKRAETRHGDGRRISPAHLDPADHISTRCRCANAGERSGSEVTTRLVFDLDVARCRHGSSRGGRFRLPARPDTQQRSRDAALRNRRTDGRHVTRASVVRNDAHVRAIDLELTARAAERDGIDRAESRAMVRALVRVGVDQQRRAVTDGV